MIVVLGIGGTHLSGFQMSVINYTSPYIQKFINETWLERYGSALPQETLMLLWSFIVSMYCIGGMVGCLCSGYLTATFGKKKCLLFNDVVLIVAVLHTGFSRRAKAFEMILVGRFLEGIAAGIHMNAHVQYAGEISPKKLRGFINVTSTVFLALGKTVARILGLRELLGSQALWPVLMASCGLPALVQLLTLPFFPESPPYLLMHKGDQEGCKKAIRQLWGEGQHQAEIDDIMKEKAAMKNTKILSVLELVKEPAFRWQLYMIIILTATIQLCGINAIYLYTFEVLQAAGFDERMASYMTLSIGLSELVAAVVCSSIIERLGRKVLLRGGYWIMASLLAAITVTLTLQVRKFCSHLVLIVLFSIVFAVGPGKFSIKGNEGIESGELISRVTEILPFIDMLILLSFSLCSFLQERLKHFCFLIFMVVLFTSGMIIHLFLPETKGKSIMEITEEFNKLNFKSKSIPATSNHVIEDYTFC
uniref:Solute carrier family 2, facilitated glucose transporter member 5 n=1 Tax=Catharus ustulatus TaxID=91951 RepID=A0A8C3VD10_CATUS